MSGYRRTPAGFRIPRRRSKARKELVGIERSVTFKTPLVDFRRTKYYRVVKRKR